MKELIESNVSYYNMHFPERFKKSKNSILYSEKEKQYIDFFSAAGSLNYGHNNEYIKKRILEYLTQDGIIQGLDMDTVAKKNFLRYFHRKILLERKLEYKVQFCGPTGTNAIEAAIRLARKITNRSGIFSLTDSFHGMTMGALAISGIRKVKSDGLVNNQPVTFIPYNINNIEGYDPVKYIEYLLEHEYSGVLLPAAIIIETVQAEGGVNVLSENFLQKLRNICDHYGILLICDDIQVGCFRTGTFFSFESSNIVPDFITLSKSISGYGIPMSILLIRPNWDIWEAGEYNGTFRGNQLAFIGAKAALEFAEQVNLEAQVNKYSGIIEQFLKDLTRNLNEIPLFRGKGMIWGIDLNPYGIDGLGNKCLRKCFEHGLIIETCGRHHNVLKILPPLTIEQDYLEKGLNIIKKSIIENL